MRNGTFVLGRFLAVAAIAATVTLGTLLRFVDPLSSPVIGAEDPYTHMAIVREHLRTGDLGPLTPEGDVYPPGLHSFLAAVWVFTGADLYEAVRLGPALLGAIGILGTALLLWRHAGPVAAFVGSLGLAVAPEAIFRTTMMSPTALDLAILPFFLYATLELTRGRLAWAGVAAPLALFQVFAHPWLFAILAITGAVFAVLALLFPRPTSPRDRFASLGVAAAIAIVGSGLGLSLTSCGGMCGPGFVDLFPPLAGYAWLAWLVILVSIAPLAMVLVRPGAVPRFLVRGRGPPMRLRARVALSSAIAGLLFLVSWTAYRQGMPEYVDLPRMVGWPLMALAAIALVGLPFLPSRLAYLGAAWFAATLPFVVFNPLHSPFWPHRTVVFLAFGLAVLAGLAAGAVTRWAHEALSVQGRRVSTRWGVGRHPWPAVVAALFVVTACAGTVYAGTPDGYPGGWYRLYSTCELDGLKQVSAVADAAPSAIVVVGSWQSKLVLSGLAQGADRIWYADEMYTDAEYREDLVIHMAKEDRPLLVVVDRYLVGEHPEADTGFLRGSEWEPVGSWCEHQGTGQPRLTLHQSEVGA